MPTWLTGRALGGRQALVPADLLVQLQPWRSQVESPPLVHWDALLWDGVAQFYPWRQFAAESLRAGRIPLWNPHQFCGTPFLANGQSAVLYPPNLVFVALPTARAFGISAWLHLALTGWFAYRLLRRMAARRPGAVLGAVAWQGNSFMVAWIHLPSALGTLSWLPAALLLIERGLVSGRGRYAVAAGAVLAVSYLGGHPQMFLFLAMLSTTYLVTRGLSGIGPLRLARRAARAGMALVVMACVGGLLAAGQLLPTLDLLRIAHRATAPGPQAYAAYLSRALPTPMLAGLLLPHAFGHPARGTYIGPENYAEHCLYVGIVALALALSAIFACRTWHARFLGAAAMASLLVALGTPLNWPLYHWLPGMSGAGGPVRTGVLAVFCLSMLAGLGCSHLLAQADEARPRGLGSLGAALLVAAVAVAVWWQTGARAVEQIEPALGPDVRTEAMRAVALLAVAGLVAVAVSRRAARGAGAVVLVAVAALDVGLAARQHVHVAPREWVYAPEARPPVTEGRVLGNAESWPLRRMPAAVLPPNAATAYRVGDAFGYDSLYLAQYRDFAALIQGGEPSPPANGNLLLARIGRVYGLDMLSLAGVDTVLSPTPIRGLELVRAGAYLTYRNPYARPRAWIAESAVFAPSRQQAVAAMVRLGALEDCLIITGPDEPAPPLGSGARPRAKVRDVSPEEVVVELSSPGGGYLFLADSHAPGWHAYADGAEVPVRIANVAFRAVPVPAGARKVVFRYQPASFRVGLFLALVGMAALCAAAAGAGAMRR